MGFAFQSIGLMTTTASRSAFLLYLNVKFVPFLALILLGRKITKSTWTSALLALSGRDELASVCACVCLYVCMYECIFMYVCECAVPYITYFDTPLSLDYLILPYYAPHYIYYYLISSRLVTSRHTSHQAPHYCRLTVRL